MKHTGPVNELRIEDEIEAYQNVAASDPAVDAVDIGAHYTLGRTGRVGFKPTDMNGRPRHGWKGQVALEVTSRSRAVECVNESILRHTHIAKACVDVIAFFGGRRSKSSAVLRTAGQVLVGPLIGAPRTAEPGSMRRSRSAIRATAATTAKYS